MKRVGSVPLNIPRRKLIYSSWTVWFAASSRISTSHSSIMTMNFLPVTALTQDIAPYKVCAVSGMMPGYISFISPITLLFIYATVFAAQPASIQHHCTSKWITSYLLRCSLNILSLLISSFSNICAESQPLL